MWLSPRHLLSISLLFHPLYSLPLCIPLICLSVLFLHLLHFGTQSASSPVSGGPSRREGWEDMRPWGKKRSVVDESLVFLYHVLHVVFLPLLLLLLLLHHQPERVPPQPDRWSHTSCPSVSVPGQALSSASSSCTVTLLACWERC